MVSKKHLKMELKPFVCTQLNGFSLVVICYTMQIEVGNYAVCVAVHAYTI